MLLSFGAVLLCFQYFADKPYGMNILQRRLDPKSFLLNILHKNRRGEGGAYNQPLALAIRAASTRFAAPSFAIASER